MPIEFNNDDIGEVYFGAERIGRVYYGTELVFERQVPVVTYDGTIVYNTAPNVAHGILPGVYSGRPAGSTISYSGNLVANSGFEFSPGVTTMAVSGETPPVPAQNNAVINVDLTGFTVTAINNLAFNQGVDPSTFAIDINGMLSITTLRNDITVMFASADADFMNGQFPQETQNTTRNVTVSFVVPAGFSNTGATLSMLLTAVQPGTAPSATAGTLGNFNPSIVNIPAAGVTSGTHSIDVTPDNGQWVITATGDIVIARSGGGDRASVSWSIPATTAARSGVITLSDDMNNVLNTYNYNQLAPTVMNSLTENSDIEFSNGVADNYPSGLTITANGNWTITSAIPAPGVTFSQDSGGAVTDLNINVIYDGTAAIPTTHTYSFNVRGAQVATFEVTLI